MARNLKESGLYTFLEESGVLETGSPEDIRQAKKKYWQEERRKWMAHKRKEGKSVQILLSLSEYEVLSKRAKNMSVTAFVKSCCLAADIPGRENLILVGIIRKTLGFLYTDIEALLQNDASQTVTDEVLNRIEQAEKSILTEMGFIQ